MKLARRDWNFAAALILVSFIIPGCDDEDRPKPVIKIQVTIKSDHLIVDYKLPFPMFDINLDVATPEIFGGSWTLLTPDLSWEGREIEHTWRYDRGIGPNRVSPIDESFKFDHFTFEVRPGAPGVDGVHPALFLVQEGGLAFFPPNFRPQRKYKASIEIVADDKAVLVSGLGMKSANGWTIDVDEPSWEEFVYVGQKVSESSESGHLFFGSTVPDWIRQSVRTQFLASYKELETGLGNGPDYPVSFFVSADVDSERAVWTRDVSGGSMSLRFHGSSWKQETVLNRQRLARFVAHKVFHFWNAAMFDAAVNDEEPWLHAGMAEFYARLASGKSEAERFQSIVNAVNGCSRNLDEESFKFIRNNNGNKYECGAVFQWLYMAMAKSEADWTSSTYVSLLSGLLEEVGGSSEFYTPEIFLDDVKVAGVSSNSLKVIQGIQNNKGREKWIELGGWLEETQQPIRLRATDDVSHMTMVRLVNKSICSQCSKGLTCGVSIYDDHLVLLAPEGCEKGIYGMSVTHVNGFRISDEKAAVVRSVLDRCRSSKKVTYSNEASGNTIELGCSKDIKEPVIQFALAE